MIGVAKITSNSLFSTVLAVAGTRVDPSHVLRHLLQPEAADLGCN